MSFSPSAPRPDEPIRVALADDHPIVLDGLEQLFRLEPDIVVVARCRNADEALRAVRSESPDVLVLDLVMPGGGGLELLRAMGDKDRRTSRLHTHELWIWRRRESGLTGFSEQA